jgi:ribosomal peptide maturation radical SAM protein 1
MYWAATRERNQMARVALISMPFASAQNPSIQLGLIKELCARAGLGVDIFHLNLDFAHAVGPELYNILSFSIEPMIGEWVFTAAAFPTFVDAEGMLERFPEFFEHIEKSSGYTRADLAELRADFVPTFVTAAANVLAAYDVVGFSTTFQQNVPSIALASALKRIKPKVKTIFGGANVEGGMGEEYLRAFECIDVVVSGECDGFIAPLLRDTLEGHDLSCYEHVFTRGIRRENFVLQGRSTFLGDLDELPLPDYSEFFERRVALGMDNIDQSRPIFRSGFGYPIYLPFESSRGCWWGEKHHCTFCGLNAGGMKFRARSPRSTVDQIEELHRRYKADFMCAVDNIIDQRTLDEFCHILSERHLGVKMFYEVKANLRPVDIRKMKEAGIQYVQPGIESFSDNVLAAMKKGITGLQNLNTLRWFRSYGLDVSWNILYGFPGERAEDYYSQTELVRKIHHLQPPFRVGPIRVDRYSPNFFDPSLRSRFGDLKPEDSYRYIYPPELNLEKAAYYFYPAVRPADTVDQNVIQPLQDAVQDWQEVWGLDRSASPFGRAGHRPFLLFEPQSAGEGVVHDGRKTQEPPREIKLSAIETRIYSRFFERPLAISRVRQDECPVVQKESEFDTALARLSDLNLLHISGDQALALAVVVGDAQS